MKRNIILVALWAMLAGATPAWAQGVTRLPQPSLQGGATLMQALQARHSSRDFADREVPDGMLSTILWAACGVNRPAEGKLTAPSASNSQDIRVYVVRRDGAYLYVPQDNSLLKVSGKDLRASVAGRQVAVAEAPLALVLVSDHHKLGGNSERATRAGACDAGYVSQNICLASSALGLNTVPRMTMDADALREELKLDEQFDFLLNNIIGFPKE